MLATVTFPEDRLPIDVILSHQLRALHSKHSRFADVVVLDNRPPWLQDKSTPQEDRLQHIEQYGVARIRKLDYDFFTDPGFLQQFFSVAPSEEDHYDQWSKDPCVPFDPSIYANINVSDLLQSARPRYFYHETREKVASNFFGMLHFLHECVNAPDSVEVCIYLDPDIFLYRGENTEKGLADLAMDLFEQNPDFIQLIPPSICDWAKDTSGGSCSNKTFPIRVEDQNLLSGRHMVLHRRNLQKALPLNITRDKFLQPFEVAWTEAVFKKGMAMCAADGVPNPVMSCKKNRLSGKMNCKGETFAIHPPDQYQGQSMESLVTQLVESAEVNASSSSRKLRGSLHSRGGALTVPPAVAEATRLLVERLEAGNFTKNSGGAWSCINMNPLQRRISRGMAWHSSAPGEGSMVKMVRRRTGA